VLVQGRLGFDGPVEEGIRFLKYDDGDDSGVPDQQVEDDLGADI
jgi:ABC-2 type transport system ATP-binding protein